jgi:tRNA nucleotidyltransferase (CCA-adding enzyme)
MLGRPQKTPRDKTKIAGIIVFHDPSKKILILKKHNGKYDLPKGHVEPGETFLEGALRECLEETGLDHRTNLDIYPYHFINIPSKKWLRFYLGFTSNSEIEISFEHDDYYWVSVKEAIDIFGEGNQFSHVIDAMDALIQEV